MSADSCTADLPAVVCPLEGCKLPVDVTFKSSEGKLLGAHARNLDTYGEGFPASDEGIVAREPVPLTENFHTLEVLLQFMHLAPQPKIRVLPCADVLAIAEAAEKYGVYSATQICAAVLEYKVKEKPSHILSFAIKHGYQELANVAAPHTLTKTLNEMKIHLKDNDYALMKWLLY